MAIELNALIRVYDDALPVNLCRDLIDCYESMADQHERVDDDRRPAFTQFNLTEHHQASEQAAKLHELVVARVLGFQKHYYGFVDARCFPRKNGLEKIRIKKYRNTGEDLFDTHVDVMNMGSCMRFMAYIFYLNDVGEGGETIFYTGKTVTPRTGRLVMFPPMWMFPHKGCAPVSNEKYIMSTYLHYQ